MFENDMSSNDHRSAEENEMKESLVPFSIDGTGKRPAGGPILFREGNTAYSDAGDAHSFILGSTGSMKTLRFVMPLIYSCAQAGESMVIADPKGELARMAGGFLETLGYRVRVLNFRDPARSADRWNPMERVQSAYKRGNDGRDDAEQYLNDLLDSICTARAGAERDIYWSHSACQLALGLCRMILAVGEELSVESLLAWRQGRLTDGTVRKYVGALPAKNGIRQNLSGYLSLTAANTKTCIESTFDQIFGIFASSSALAGMMSDSTFAAADIAEEKTACFLIIPDEKTTLHFCASLFIGQCYESLLDKAEHCGGRLPRRVNFICEEFANMPKLSDINAMLSAARSRNIRFHLVCQSYSQLLEKYGENMSRTILDNCGNLIYLHTRDTEFLKYLSGLAGENTAGRPRLTTVGLQRLRKNETLIVHERCLPLLVRDIPTIFEYPVVLGTELPEPARKISHLRSDEPADSGDGMLHEEKYA